MPTIVTLRDAIKTDLEAIVDDLGIRTIKVVYNYPESKPEGYPYAYVLYLGDESEELTNTQEKVSYRFEINLIQEKIEELKGRENAEATAMTRAYSIAEKFRADDDLSTAGVLRVRPIKTEKSYVDGNTRIQLKTILEVDVVETISI
jgi:hypothetical protein